MTGGNCGELTSCPSISAPNNSESDQSKSLGSAVVEADVVAMPTMPWCGPKPVDAPDTRRWSIAPSCAVGSTSPTKKSLWTDICFGAPDEQSEDEVAVFTYYIANWCKVVVRVK